MCICDKEALPTAEAQLDILSYEVTHYEPLGLCDSKSLTESQFCCISSLFWCVWLKKMF